MVGLYIWCFLVGLGMSFVTLIVGASVITDSYPKLGTKQTIVVVILTLIISLTFAFIGGFGYQHVGEL